MTKITVYYDEDYQTGGFVPTRLNVYFGSGNIPWDEDYVYISLDAPFDRMTAEDYSPEIMSLSITQGELIRNIEHPTQLGIYLPYVVMRLEKAGAAENPDFDYNDIEQIVILMGDIEEIMQMELRSKFEWK